MPSDLTANATTTAKEDAAFWKSKYEAVCAGSNNIDGIVEEAGQPSRYTLYRLVLGMAIARFEHRTGQNSAAVKAIENAIFELDITELRVKEDTIRKVLNAASEKLLIQHATALQWRGVRRKI